MRVTMGSRAAPRVRQTMERRARAAANMQKLAEAREAHVGEVEYELRVAREDVAELRARLTQPRAAGDRNGDPGAAAGHAERGGGGGDARGGGSAPEARGPPDEPRAAEGEAAGAAAGGLGEGALALSARCAASATDGPRLRWQPPLGVMLCSGAAGQRTAQWWLQGVTLDR